MRQDRIQEVLAALPANGYIEVVQDVDSGAPDSSPSFVAASLLGAAGDLTTLEAEVDAIVAGAETAVTATADGLTTGLIPATAQFVTVTSDDATKQITLPAAVAGKRIQIFVPATGCELVSAVATDKVNGVVVGATNEAALAAAVLYTLVYDGVDNWVMQGLTALGAVDTPVVPDAL